MKGPRLTFAIACAALAATAASLSLSPGGRALADALVADGRIAHEPWRIFTGSLVHATWWHLVRDVALMLAIGIAYEQRLRARWPWIVALGLAAPPIAVIAGGADGYYGLSGLSHAMLAAALVCELEDRRGRSRAIVAAIAALLAIKIVVEACTGGSSATALLPRSAWLDLGPHVHQAPLAHLAGAIAGVLAMAATRARSAASARRSSPA